MTSKPESPPTYQDLLDEAIEETFPASDPISPAIGKAERPAPSERNPVDWEVQPEAPPPKG